MTNVKEDKKTIRESAHFISAHAYLLFFGCVLLGVILDMIISFDMFENAIYSQYGFLIIIIGTFIIFWAQKSSGKARKISMEESSTEAFNFGPYKFVRHPTYVGLFILAFGFSVVIQSISSMILVVIAHVLIKFTFVKKEEKFLEKKYGDKYLAYRNKRKKKL